MKVEKVYNEADYGSIDNKYVQARSTGRCYSWKRTYFLASPTEKKIAILTLNLFERIVWFVQELILRQTYYKFETVFQSKNFQILSFGGIYSTILQGKTTQKTDSIDPSLKPDSGNNKESSQKELHPTVPDSVKSIKEAQTNEGLKIQNENIPHGSNTQKTDTIGPSLKPNSKNGKESPQKESHPSVPDSVKSLEEVLTSLKEAQTNEGLKVQKLIQNGQWEEAFEANNKLIYSQQKTTNNFLIAKAFIEMNQFEKTIEMLKKSSFQYDDLWIVHARLVKAYIQQGNLEKALEFLKDNYVKKEDAEIVYSEIIKAYIQKNNLEKALEILKNKHLKESDHLHSEIVKAYFNQNNFENAIKILEIKLESTIAHSLAKDFAITCCQNGKYKEAIKFIRVITDKDKLIGKIFLKVAEEQFQKGLLEKALEIASQLKDTNISGEEDFYIKIGNAYVQQGDLDKAAKAYEKIFYHITDKHHVLSDLAKKYYEKKDYENALKYISNEKNYVSAKKFYLQIANAYHEQGKDDEALNVLEEIVSHGYLVSKDLASIKMFITAKDYKNALSLIAFSPVRKAALTLNFTKSLF